MIDAYVIDCHIFYKQLKQLKLITISSYNSSHSILKKRLSLILQKATQAFFLKYHQ